MADVFLTLLIIVKFMNIVSSTFSIYFQIKECRKPPTRRSYVYERRRNLKQNKQICNSSVLHDHTYHRLIDTHKKMEKNLFNLERVQAIKKRLRLDGKKSVQLGTRTSDQKKAPVIGTKIFSTSRKSKIYEYYSRSIEKKTQ